MLPLSYYVIQILFELPDPEFECIDEEDKESFEFHV